MRINFKHIHIENFMSYECADVDLNHEGYTIVRGVNNNPLDNAKSNGTGKSSLFSAISYALTGETISGIKNVSNINTQDGALVELDFTLDSHDCKIIRTKDHSKYKTNLKIFIDGEDKSGKGIRDGEKLLNEYFPDLTSSLINSVVILGQGLPGRFTNNTPAGRKEVLEQLSKSDFMIADLKNRISSRKSELNNDQRTYEDNQLETKTLISVAQKELDSIELQLVQLEEFDLGTAQESIKLAEEKIRELEEGRGGMQTQVEEYTNISFENQNKLKILYNNKEEEISQIDTSKVDEKNKEIYELKAKITSLKSEIKKLENVVDTCPTCGQKLPDVHVVDTTELREQLSDAESAQNEAVDDYEKLISEIGNKKEEINVKFNKEINEVEEHQKVIKNDINSLNNTIQECALQISTHNQHKQKLESQIATHDEAVERLNNSKTAQSTIIDSYKNCLVDTEKNLEIIKQHIEVVNKMSSIITREFRGHLLINVISYINNRVNYYSKFIFNDPEIIFELNGNNISIRYDNREYESLSGGEKQKIDIIVQLAIRDMLCKFMNFSSNIIVLDEITDNLDEVGAECLFNLISNELNGVSSIYVISHHQDFSIPIDNEIIITKGDDKISRIV